MSDDEERFQNKAVLEKCVKKRKCAYVYVCVRACLIACVCAVCTGVCLCACVCTFTCMCVYLCAFLCVFVLCVCQVLTHDRNN